MNSIEYSFRYGTNSGLSIGLLVIGLAAVVERRLVRAQRRRTRGPERKSLSHDAACWYLDAGRPLVLYNLSLIAFMTTIRTGVRSFAVVPAVIGLVALLRLSTLAAERAGKDHLLGYRPAPGQILVNLCVAVIWVILAWLFTKMSHAGVYPAEVTFAAVGMAVVFVGSLFTGLRQHGEPGRWPLLFAGTAAIGVGFVLVVPPPGWWLTAVVAASLLCGLLAVGQISEAWLGRAPAMSARAWWTVIAAGTAALISSYGSSEWGALVSGVAAAAAIFALARAIRSVRSRRAPAHLIENLDKRGNTIVDGGHPDAPAASPAGPVRGFWTGEGSMLLAGLAVIGSGYSALVIGGASPLAAVVVVTVVSALVALTAVPRNGLVVPVALVITIPWMLAPGSVDEVAATRQSRDGRFFVTFGDSYTSGEGASEFIWGTNTQTKSDYDGKTNQCRRANTAWPVMLAEDGVAGVPGHVMFVACSGAVTYQLQDIPPKDPEDRKKMATRPKELDEFREKFDWFADPSDNNLTTAPAFALVGIGGNDALFGTIGQSCVGPGDCSTIKDRFLKVVRTDLRARLRATYYDIDKAMGGSVPIVVTPYPDPVFIGPVTRWGQCNWVFLNRNERIFIREFVSELNAAIQIEANLAGAYYLEDLEHALGYDRGDGTAYDEDGRSYSRNIRLCDGADYPGVNFFDMHPQDGTLLDAMNPKNWTHNSLHPNEDGHIAMEEAAEVWFKMHPVDQLKTPTEMRSEIGFGPLERPELGPMIDGQDVIDGWVGEQFLALMRRSMLPIVSIALGSWLLVMACSRRAVRAGWGVPEGAASAWAWCKRMSFGPSTVTADDEPNHVSRP